MPFEPVFETFNVRKVKAVTANEIKIECRTDIPSDAVKKVIGIETRASVSCGDVALGKAEFFGKAVFFIVYESVEGELKKCECGAEFKDVAVNADIPEGGKARFSCKTEKAEASLSGVNLSATALVTVKGEISAEEKISAVSGGEGIIADIKERPFVKKYAAKDISYPVEEEFEVNYKVKEVIEHKAAATVTAVQCGVGAVICDGEIYLTEIFLQSEGKNDIIREDRVIPFRIEAECEEAMPALSASAIVSVKSVKTDVAVDEDGGISQVVAAVVLDVSAEAESVESVKIAEDAFSTEQELLIKKGKAESFTGGEIKTEVAVVKERFATEELPSDARLCAVMGESAEVVSAEKTEGGVSVTGTVSATALYRTEDGIIPIKTEFPFEKFVETDEEDAEISVTAKKARGKIITLTETETEAELIFTVRLKKRYEVSFVAAAEEGAEKPAINSAVSVYIPIAGEGLWELAKRLNESPEKLVSTNPDLQFPLSGAERIVVYRQK